MYHTRLAGTYYEMGFKYGKILRKIGYNPPKLPEELKEFANECEKEVKRVFHILQPCTLLLLQYSFQKDLDSLQNTPKHKPCTLISPLWGKQNNKCQ